MRSSVVLLILVLLFGVSAWAGPVDGTVDQILSEYFKIQQALAADTTEGVTAPARTIHRLATSAEVADDDIRKLFEQVAQAAQAIQDKPLSEARDAFFELSKPLLVYLDLHHAEKSKYFRYYCPMVNKAWVQAEKGVKNPYQGSSMLTCGRLIE